MTTDSLQLLLQHLRARGTATARELTQALGVSQPTISRAIRQAGSAVIAIGQARARRYAASRDVRGLGDHWPLYRIDRQGRPTRAGMLHALHGDRLYFAADQTHEWLRGEFADGLFPGLPWFMDDMRPQGFLGRAFAHHFGPVLGLRKELALWNQDDVLTALLLHGDDTTGDFVLGEAALEQALAHDPTPLARDERDAAYARLADAVMAGEPAGSSAAGEQPKFTACVETTSGQAQHVIVKFSEPVAGEPVARRWADLLWAEYVANQVLAGAGIEVADTEVLTVGARRMLQSARFDRTGAHGRSGFISLAAVDDAHFGGRDSWAQAAARLQQAGWISAADAQRIVLCWWFGRLIGNTDMHFGNLGLQLDEHLPLRLAPIYDMLPMHYSPSAGGGVSGPAHVPPPPVPEHMDSWRRACRLAQDFWSRLGDVPGLSPAFRAVATQQLETLDALNRRFG